MADATHIEWADATWNVVTGCAVVSPGCTNCYAMKLAGGRLRHHPSRAGLTIDTKPGPVWNGQVRFNAEWLTQPLRWTKPRMIFVAAHGDLFHEGVTDDQRDQIFAVMALCPQHVFQILTKRPERMRDYVRGLYCGGAERWLSTTIDRGNGPAMFFDLVEGGFLETPLANVWLGVSVEDQARADERIPVLLDTPAAVRWISAEPLLGPVDLTRCGRNSLGLKGDTLRWPGMSGPSRSHGARIDWVVAGGESGPGARPMHPDWARQLRDQCAAAGVPFLFKQWGAWAPDDHVAAHGGHDTVVLDDDTPAGQVMFRVGKKAAGRLLDGVLHDAFPEARS